MNYNQTLPTPTGLEQWQPHIYELKISRDGKDNIVLEFAEMGVAIVRYVLTPKLRNHLMNTLMQA
ncbi:hypothetical protein SGGMMB4_04251 [Sodalis glossinidius str. 'morsitans']|uniref:Uncharacterized protein n=1 Tax=Sodalis glossinidius (strain morsitans) TaxID=343509 RepID=A0A193QM77_SODGM|nr:hypothetical protein [Sodalis glossinidius]CRL46030.1 hypothetical protein SGGMMB4_04251 [Sodalis glossinidius str. 'morsitans']